MKQQMIARRKWLIIACTLAGVLLPVPALAHVKWFVDATAYPLQTNLIWSERSLMWLGSSGLAVALLYLVHRQVPKRTWPWTPWLVHMAAGAPTILTIQAAVALIATAVHPALLAPNLNLQPGPVGLALSVLQVVCAFALITGVADWLGGALLIALVGLVGVLFSPSDALEQVAWVGIGIAVLAIQRDGRPNRWLRALPDGARVLSKRRGIVALRVLTGASLIVVAVTEKLWNPALGRAFLLDRPELNVFQTLPGMSWFSDDVFVLAAGLFEAAIGAMLISGFAPRLVILAMWLPFNLGIPVLPSQELLGHLPILGIMYVLLVDGTPVVASPTVTRTPRPIRTVQDDVTALRGRRTQSRDAILPTRGGNPHSETRELELAGTRKP